MHRRRGLTARKFSDGSVQMLAGGRRWQDEHPEALQTRVDPGITFTKLDWSRSEWSLPAGWVGIMNRLHLRLIETQGPDYEIFQIGIKAGWLRCLLIHPREGRNLPGMREAREESLQTCDLCGGPAPRSSQLPTRCPEHPGSGPDKVYGARALPPGLS
ncbi:MAG: hypothetical protein ACTHV8_10895 [Nesterenkonia sp.]